MFGDHVWVVEEHFKMTEKNVQKARDALVKAHYVEDSTGTLQQLFIGWGWVLFFDGENEDGSVEWIDCTSHTHMDAVFEAEKLFAPIAPFVRRGSYIVVSNGDGERICYRFMNKKCYKLEERNDSLLKEFEKPCARNVCK
jgi:hypothetical protein